MIDRILMYECLTRLAHHMTNFASTKASDISLHQTSNIHIASNSPTSTLLVCLVMQRSNVLFIFILFLIKNAN